MYLAYMSLSYMSWMLHYVFSLFFLLCFNFGNLTYIQDLLILSLTVLNLLVNPTHWHPLSLFTIVFYFQLYYLNAPCSCQLSAEVTCLIRHVIFLSLQNLYKVRVTLNFLSYSFNICEFGFVDYSCQCIVFSCFVFISFVILC